MRRSETVFSCPLSRRQSPNPSPRRPSQSNPRPRKRPRRAPSRPRRSLHLRPNRETRRQTRLRSHHPPRPRPRHPRRRPTIACRPSSPLRPRRPTIMGERSTAGPQEVRRRLGTVVLRDRGHGTDTRGEIPSLYASEFNNAVMKKMASSVCTIYATCPIQHTDCFFGVWKSS